MTMSTDPHPANPLSSLPLGSTRPLLVQTSHPDRPSVLDLHSPIPKLMTTPDHQGCFMVPKSRFASRAATPAATGSLNLHS
jgi:hypothetical protein